MERRRSRLGCTYIDHKYLPGNVASAAAVAVSAFAVTETVF